MTYDIWGDDTDYRSKRMALPIPPAAAAQQMPRQLFDSSMDLIRWRRIMAPEAP